MKLSNFDWTDKTSVRWFVIGPKGHEGPYDFISLQEKCCRENSSKTMVWAEGLLHKYEFSIVAKQFFLNDQLDKLEQISLTKIDIDIPLEEELEDFPPPLKEVSRLERGEAEPKIQPRDTIFKAFILILLFLSGLIFHYRLSEKFSILRPQKMPLSTFEEIQRHFYFEGWDKELSFKAYTAPDLSEVWLVTSSFKNCRIEAKFSSIENKLLSLKENSIVFKTKGRLVDHVLPLSKFEFLSGSKVIPGLYEVEIRTSECTWGSPWSYAVSSFRNPANEDTLKLNFVIYPGGELSYHLALGKILQKKAELGTKKRNKEKILYQDVILKYQTLKAISQQVEDLLFGFLDKNKKWNKEKISELSRMYSRNQAHFLTKFLIDTENYFKTTKSLKNSELIKTEEELRSVSKDIGEVSMNFFDKLVQSSIEKSYIKDSLQKVTSEEFSKIHRVIEAKITQLTNQMDSQL